VYKPHGTLEVLCSRRSEVNLTKQNGSPLLMSPSLNAASPASFLERPMSILDSIAERLAGLTEEDVIDEVLGGICSLSCISISSGKLRGLCICSCCHILPFQVFCCHRHQPQSEGDEKKIWRSLPLLPGFRSSGLPHGLASWPCRSAISRTVGSFLYVAH